MKKLILFSILMTSLTGCAHSIHEFTVSDPYSPSKERPNGRSITAKSEQFVILYFAFNTDYADQAYEDLKSKCPKGNIVQISARYSTSFHFLSFTNKVYLQGICLEESKT